ncbi:hypothetical protein ACFY8N_39765 [Streptomyces collinus]|uniref:hypothetical protein n=1 Tax=Streptomyces collinus TaxID=42684 RepID=UPI0036BC23B6
MTEFVGTIAIVFELARFTRMGFGLTGVVTAGELEEDVAECARDDRAHQHAGGGVRDQGLRGEPGGGPHAVGRESRGCEPPSLLALLGRRHLYSYARGLV